MARSLWIEEVAQISLTLSSFFLSWGQISCSTFHVKMHSYIFSGSFCNWLVPVFYWSKQNALGCPLKNVSKIVWKYLFTPDASCSVTLPSYSSNFLKYLISIRLPLWHHKVSKNRKDWLLLFPQRSLTAQRRLLLLNVLGTGSFAQCGTFLKWLVVARWKVLLRPDPIRNRSSSYISSRLRDFLTTRPRSRRLSC